MPPSSERSRDATTTSLLSITEKCSVAEMGYVLIVGSNPGIPDVSGGGPDEHAQASVAASTTAIRIVARAVSW